MNTHLVDVVYVRLCIVEFQLFSWMQEWTVSDPVYVYFKTICFQPTEHQSSNLLFPRRWTAARWEDSPSWSLSASWVFCCSLKLQTVGTVHAKIHTGYHHEVVVVMYNPSCPLWLCRYEELPAGVEDKGCWRGRQSLHRKTRKRKGGCRESVEETPGYIWNRGWKQPYTGLQGEPLHNCDFTGCRKVLKKNFRYSLLRVFVVPQLSVPAAEPASGLPEDHHLPESHFSQWDWLQRQGDSSRHTWLFMQRVALVCLFYKMPINVSLYWG